MHRRDFLTRSVLAGLGFASTRWSGAILAARESDRRTFEVVTRIHVQDAKGATKVWIPEPIRQPMPFQKTVSVTVDAPGGRVSRAEQTADALTIASVLFPAGVSPTITMTTRVSTRDYMVDLTRGVQAAPASLDHFRRPTRLIPTTGIVRDTALEITKGAKGDVEKAQAIYEWVVDETHRDGAVQGCGTGDIRFMLETGNLGGKCADINAL